MSRHDTIPGDVRAQLLALGIPAQQHSAAVLATLFPRELNIDAAGLSAEDLARVLVHFAGTGLVSVAGNTRIKKVAPGWHSCHFYRDDDQLLATVAPYIAEGLQNGEGCLWVMPKSVPKKAASAAIEALIGDVNRYIGSGQLELLSHPNWYLDAAGRFKSFEEISGALLARQDLAISRGFKSLRAAGDAGWVSGTEESKEFIDYEMKVNAALGATKVAAICMYRADATADELVAIVTAHQDALYTVAGA